MEGKYFELSIKTDHYNFVVKQDKMYEILDALDEASIAFKFEINRDAVMESLYEIKNGGKLSAENCKYRIVLRDGEI